MVNKVVAIVSTVGTGNVVVGNTFSGFRSFATIPANTTVFYEIDDFPNWEIGSGIWDGISQLSRNQSDSSANGAIISLSGKAVIQIINPASLFIQSGSGAIQRTLDSKIKDYEVSVLDFGADPTGIVDSTTAIQNAINSLPATGGIVLLPHGIYSINTTLTIGNGTTTTVSTVNNICFIGSGPGASSADSTSTGAATRLLWNGANNGIMFQINGPISGVKIVDIALDANSLASQAIVVLHAFSSRFSDILIENYTIGPAFQLKSRDAAISGMVRGCDDNLIQSVKVINPQNSGSNAADFGSSNPTNGTIVGMSRNTFINCFWVAGSSGTALTLRYFDNNTFLGVTLLTLNITPVNGNALGIIPPTNAQTFPNEVTFYGCPIIGTRIITGSWTTLGTAGNGITFIPSNIGDDHINRLVHPNSWGQYTTSTRMRQGTTRTHLSAPQSLTNNVEVAISWNVEDFNTDFFHNNSTNPTRYTASLQGVYSFGAGLDFAANTAGTRYMYFKVNGATNMGLSQAPGNVGQDTWLQLRDDIQLNAGDYVELLAFQNSGGALNIINGLGTYMYAHYIGGD